MQGKPAPTVFSGEDRVVIRRRREFGSEEIVLRHEKGEPQEPPFRRERVPLLPRGPRRERQEEAKPSQEPEVVVSAVGKKR